jgi:hypothetical protein
VKAAWERAKLRGEDPTLMQKTSDVHSELHEWDRKILKGPARKLKELKADLERLRRGPMTDATLATHKRRFNCKLNLHWKKRKCIGFRGPEQIG